MSLRRTGRLTILALIAMLGLTTAANAAPAQRVNAQGTYTIVLDYLLCYETEDWGADEAYIKLNGSKVWGPRSINNGQKIDVNISRTFSGSVNINLFDEDWPDADDQIANTNTVYEGAAGQGQLSMPFLTENGPRYELFYHVY